MIKSFNFYIVLMSLPLSLPMMSMEPEPTLLQTILVREAHKTESKRNEHIGQAFTALLYDSYKTAITRNMRFQEIRDLSKEAKASLEITLENDISQLLDQLSKQSCIMRNLIGTTNFNQIVGHFNIAAAQHLVHAFNCADISEAESNFYALVHSRNATNARVQATNEIIARYYSFPEKRIKEEDEDLSNNEKENIHE